MQLAYPTGPLERDCRCESQLFLFCHAGQSTLVPDSGHNYTFLAYRRTGSFQLSDTAVPDSGHNSTLICTQAYLIIGSFLLDSSLLSAQ